MFKLAISNIFYSLYFMKNFKQMHLPKFLSILCCFIIGNQAFTQLIVNKGIDEVALIETLVGSGVEVDPGSVTIKCPEISYGAFEGETNVGVANGLIMATGNTDVAAGPNNESRAGNTNFSPYNDDADLEKLIPGFEIVNACIIEFDFIPKSDTLNFNFVFGSEEFSEFVEGDFNDVFGFFVSGPGINGTFENNAENIAVVPGTDIPISIQTVNNGATPQGYGEPNGPCTNCEYFVFNGDGRCFNNELSCRDETYIQYDGFTTVITTNIAVVPCETYHIKLAIADGGDSQADSGVFIQGQSFSTKGIEIIASGYEDGVDFPNAAAGCTNAKLTFINTLDVDEARTISYNIGGTAREGIDYQGIPNEVSFDAGESEVELFFDILDDGIANEDRFLEIYFFNANCSGSQFDTIRLTIEDFPVFSISEDQTICAGEDASLLAQNGFNYNWTDSSLSNPNLANQMVSPQATTTYTSEIDYGRCKENLSTTVEVVNNCDCPDEPVNVTTAAVTVCSGDVVNLSAFIDVTDPSILASISWQGPAEVLNNEFVAVNSTCAPSTQVYVATCALDETDVLSTNIEVTVYPSDLTSFLNENVLGCSVGVFPGRLCSEYITVSERQIFDTCGQGEAIFNVSYKLENACIETFEYKVDYNCTTPVSMGSATVNQAYVCSGVAPDISVSDFNITNEVNLYYVFHNNENLSSAGYTSTTEIYGYSLDDLAEIVQDSKPCGQEIFVTPFTAETIDNLNNFSLGEACVSMGNTEAITFLCPIELEVVCVCNYMDNTGELNVTITGGFPGIATNALFNITGDVFEGMVAHSEQFQVAGLADSSSYIINVEDEFGCTASLSETIICEPKLPIELISFSGEAMANGNQLKWITATEINNDYFTINTSKDGANFEKLITLEGNGNSNSAKNYSFIDRNAEDGTTYYQLLQTDFDGMVNIAAYLEITRGEKLETNHTINLYPNPVNEELTIQFSQTNYQPVNINLTNLQGHLILSKIYNVQQGVNEFQLSTVSLSKGIYMIAIDNGAEVYYQKLVKH